MLTRTTLIAAILTLPSLTRAQDPVTFTIDTSPQKSHPISPYIYGINFPDWKNQKNIPFTRFGGNRITAYNWENNASNAGSDWQNQNDNMFGDSNDPGKAMKDSIANAFSHNTSIVLSIPTLGYVAADKNGGGDVNKTPDYLHKRFVESVPKKSAPFTDKPDPKDDKVYQDECVAFLEKNFPTAHTDSTHAVFYALDNEPDLWSSTHARIHPKPITYEELCKNNIDYATAIKSVAPKSLVFGFVSYGWMGFSNLQNAPDANGRNVLDVYLGAMAAAEKTKGHRLIDVLDLHWYPEAQGDKKRIVDDGDSPGLAAARIQAPRSLWDPNYKESSWIMSANGNKPLALIPNIFDRINKHYPGTKLSFTEYYYGGGDHISGALAQADVLGIFGRENIFAAALWHVGNSKDTFIHAAFDMFRNYDGKGSAVGDTSLAATTTDNAASSIYATKNAKGLITLIAINKTDSKLPADITFKTAPTAKSATLYQLTADEAKSKPAGTTPLTAGHIKLDLPALSVTTIVLDTP